ncbi:hypothetical protein QJQ45_010276 [Haematococcus lacustris]|nr:hypothetical protein QJQ45_010276 [Haematococcus lacustris]
MAAGLRAAVLQQWGSQTSQPKPEASVQPPTTGFANTSRVKCSSVLTLEEVRRRFDKTLQQTSRYGVVADYARASPDHDFVGLPAPPLRLRQASPSAPGPLREGSPPTRQSGVHGLPAWRGLRRRQPRSESNTVTDQQARQDLQQSVQAVAAEVGLPPAVSRVIAEAVLRGRLPSNPGVLLAQLLRFQTGLQPLLGQRAMHQVLRAQPSLVMQAGELLTWHMEELAGCFGALHAARMVCRSPGLLALPPTSMWQSLELLSCLLDCPIEAATKVARRQSTLLLLPAACLEQRMLDLQDVTGLGLSQLQRLVLAQPSLLTYHPATLAANMEALAVALHTAQPAAAALATATVADLAAVSQLAARSPALAMLAPGSVATKLAALAAMLGCSSSHAATLVRRQPSLLNMSSDLLIAKLNQLATELACPASLLPQQVSLPAMNPKLHPKRSLPAACLTPNPTDPGPTDPITPDPAGVALALANPALMTLAPGSLSRKLAALQAVLQQVQLLQVHGAPAGARTQQPTHVRPSLLTSLGMTASGDSSQAHCTASTGNQLTPSQPLTSQQRQPAYSLIAPYKPDDDADAPSIDQQVCLGCMWRQQLREASPRVRAALACFSCQRHQRLLRLGVAVGSGSSCCHDADALHSAALGADGSGLESGPGQGSERSQPDPQGEWRGRLSLSRVLRMTDAEFAQLLLTM